MNLKKACAWAAAVVLAAGSLSGCASRAKVTEDMIPRVTNLQEGQTEAAPVLQGLSMNGTYLSELLRRDGDNTETVSVAARDVQVELKATSVDRDLKIKFVDAKKNRVITGVLFAAEVTDPDKKTKSYEDKDKDGIIHIQDLTGGKYTVVMKAADGFAGGETITASVKGKIEYAVIDVADEIKKESEIDVSQEDGAHGSGMADASAGDGGGLKDTVEWVESTKTEIYSTDNAVQKKDSFGQPMYTKQKLDKYGTPMYARILSEPAADHTDANGDGKCDRCGASLGGSSGSGHVHSYVEKVTEPTCTKPGKIERVCSCGAVESTETIEELGHIDENGDGKCDRCGASLSATIGKLIFPWDKLTVSAAAPTKIVYDTGSAPVYDTSSEPVYEDRTVIGYKYTGWQNIDGVACYYDKNGNRVTGTQVIQGVQYTFTDEGKRSGNVGIDVSKFQSSIDWNKVKASGVSFVMVRCGYRGYGSGVLVEDPMFRSHISGARAAGLKVGVYFFSQAVTEAEAVEEASMAISLVKKMGGVSMPFALDSEYAAGGAGRADGLSRSQRTTITRAFCNTIANSGYTPMVYASKSWFADHLNASALGSYKIWVAHYASECGYSGKYHMWQYTSSGSVPGVKGKVDMNYSYM